MKSVSLLIPRWKASWLLNFKTFNQSENICFVIDFFEDYAWIQSPPGRFFLIKVPTEKVKTDDSLLNYKIPRGLSCKEITAHSF